MQTGGARVLRLQATAPELVYDRRFKIMSDTRSLLKR